MPIEVDLFNRFLDEIDKIKEMHSAGYSVYFGPLGFSVSYRKTRGYSSPEKNLGRQISQAFEWYRMDLRINGPKADV